VKGLLRNLLSNAVRHTQHGSVTIEVQTADDGVEVRVIDTGALSGHPTIIGRPAERDTYTEENHHARCRS